MKTWPVLENKGVIYYFSVISIPESFCFISVKLTGEKKSLVSRDVARIVPRQFLKSPLLSLPPQIWKLLLCIFFIVRLTTLCCMLHARRNEIEQMALKVAWCCDILGRKACRYRGVRVHPPPEDFKNLDTF